MGTGKTAAYCLASILLAKNIGKTVVPVPLQWRCRAGRAAGFA